MLLRRERAKYPTARQRATYNQVFNWKYPAKVESLLRSALQGTFQTNITAKVSKSLTILSRAKEKESYKLDDADEEFIKVIRDIEIETNKSFEDDKVFGILAALFFLKFTEGIENATVVEMNRFVLKYFGNTLDVIVPNSVNLRSHFSNHVRSKMQYYYRNYFNKLYNAFNTYKIGNMTLGEFSFRVSELNLYMTKAVSAFVSRDNVGTYLSAVQQDVFNNLGFSHYQWQTAQDERVRGDPLGLYPRAVPSHFMMDSVVCKNDDATVYSADNGKTWMMRGGKMPLVHPGEAPNCRCVRIPFIKRDMAIIDKELADGSRST